MNNDERLQDQLGRDALRMRRHYTQDSLGPFDGPYLPTKQENLEEVIQTSIELFGGVRTPAIRTETNAAASEASGGGVTHPPVSGSSESIQEAP